MSRSSNDDPQRLQRLREEQLRARDPSRKDQAKMQRISARHSQRAKREVTLRSLLHDIPLRVWYSIGGVAFGVLLVIIMHIVVPLAWPGARWMPYVSGVLLLAGYVIGRFLGKVMEWRSDWSNR